MISLPPSQDMLRLSPYPERPQNLRQLNTLQLPSLVEHRPVLQKRDNKSGDSSGGAVKRVRERERGCYRVRAGLLREAVSDVQSPSLVIRAIR